LHTSRVLEVGHNSHVRAFKIPLVNGEGHLEIFKSDILRATDRENNNPFG